MVPTPRGAGCNEHTSWPEVAFGHCPSRSPIDGSPKTDCPTAAIAAVAAAADALPQLQWDQRQMS